VADSCRLWYTLNMKKTIAAILIALSATLFLSPAQAADFNPNYIISDAEILDYNALTLDEVKNFVASQPGTLKNYVVTEKDGLPPEVGTSLSATEVIYDRAVANKINPKFLLVLIQKEQSLLTDQNPKQSQYDWAAGYGCPDGGGCNPRWQGFYKQMNSAALQFYSYITEPHLYSFKAGQTYTFTNPYGTISTDNVVVTPANNATAGLYNYTPHVYNGNYNFWRFWNHYFSRFIPVGSLVQADGEAGVWLIKDGLKHPFLSRGALLSRYDPNKILPVKKTDLDAYSKGAPIRFPQYSLVRSPQGDIYLLVDDTKRKIQNLEVFRQLGFNSAEVEQASSEDLAYYADANPITLAESYPTGALLQDPASGGIYYVIDGTKAPLIDAIFLKTKFKNQPVIKSSANELASFEKIDPVKLDDGYLLKAADSPGVFVISGGRKRAVASAQVFEKLGYKWENVLTVNPRVLAQFDYGEPLTEEALMRE